MQEAAEGTVRPILEAGLEELTPAELGAIWLKYGASPYAVGLRIGGTNISSGLVNRTGEVEVRTALPEADWRRIVFGQTEGSAEKIAALVATNGGPEARAVADRIAHEAIRHAVAVVRNTGLDPRQLRLVHVSLASGQVNEETGVSGPQELTENLPGFHYYPLGQVVQDGVERELGVRPTVHVRHDIQSALMGEVLLRRGAPETGNLVAMIWGTGVNAAAQRAGRPFTGGDSFREVGLALVGRQERDGPHYRFRGFELLGKKPRLEAGEFVLEQRLGSYFLGQNFSGEALRFGSGEELTDRASDQSPRAEERVAARAVIARIGAEMGRGIAALLAPYLESYGFVPDRFVLMSGVGENLGRGVRDDKDRDLLIGAIRDAASAELTTRFGVDAEAARRVVDGIVRSQTDARRELIAAADGLAAGLEEWVGPVDAARWRTATDPDTALIQSFSGIRARAGVEIEPPVRQPLPEQELSPEHKLIFARYGYEFARYQILRFLLEDPERKEFFFALARDPRPSGRAVLEAQMRGMLRAGEELGVRILFWQTLQGVLPTPFAEGLVRTHPRGRSADGGVIATASHNPLVWNGVKYPTAARQPGDAVVQEGTLLPAREMSEIVRRVRQWIAAVAGDPAAAKADREALNRIGGATGRVRWVSEGRVLGQMVREARRMWGLTDPAAFRRFRTGARHVRVVLDPNGGAASGFYRQFLERFGFTVFEINNVRGQPQHMLEPVGQALEDAKKALKEHRAHFAVVFDYDADRGNTLLSVMDPATGEVTDVTEPNPQEVAAMNVAMALAKDSVRGGRVRDTRPRAVVMHDASSRRNREIARIFGAELFIVETGEVNVIEKMRGLEREGYRPVIGIEGANGGTIFRGQAEKFQGDTSRNGAMTALVTGMLRVQPEIGQEWLRLRNLGAPKDVVPVEIQEQPPLAYLLKSLPGERGMGSWHFETPIWKQGVAGEVPEALTRLFQEKVVEVWEEQIRPLLESGRLGARVWPHARLTGVEIFYSRETQIHGLQAGPEKHGGGLTVELKLEDGSSAFVWMRGSQTEGMQRASVEGQGSRAREITRELRELYESEWYPAALGRARLAHDATAVARARERMPEEQAGLEEIELPVGATQGQIFFIGPEVAQPALWDALRKLRPAPGEQIPLLIFARDIAQKMEIERALERERGAIWLAEPVISVQEEYEGNLQRALQERAAHYRAQDANVQVRRILTPQDLEELAGRLQIPEISARTWTEQATAAVLEKQL